MFTQLNLFLYEKMKLTNLPRRKGNICPISSLTLKTLAEREIPITTQPYTILSPNSTIFESIQLKRNTPNHETSTPKCTTSNPEYLQPEPKYCPPSLGCRKEALRRLLSFEKGDHISFHACFGARTYLKPNSHMTL